MEHERLISTKTPPPTALSELGPSPREVAEWIVNQLAVSPCTEFGLSTYDFEADFDIRSPEGNDLWFYDRYLRPYFDNPSCQLYDSLIDMQLSREMGTGGPAEVRAKIQSTTYYAFIMANRNWLESDEGLWERFKRLGERLEANGLPRTCTVEELWEKVPKALEYGIGCSEAEYAVAKAAGDYGWEDRLLCGLRSPEELKRIATESPDCVAAALAERVLERLKAEEE